jgi:serine/threonine protein kinase
MGADDWGDRVGGFGPYRPVRVIGSGGMGLVYEAIDTRLGLRVALKQLHPHVANRSGAAARFLREGRAAARVRHPHVVQVFTLGTGEDGPYLAMELLEGCDLGKVLRQEGRLDVEAALAILLPVISAVAKAHVEGVIHRDLKPSNVFVSRGAGGRPHPTVLDFGVSKVLGDGDAGPVTATDSVLGTFEYMPPELAHTARDASYASDQYSLAVILYQCVTGDLPFTAGGVHELLQAIMTAPVPSPSQRVPGIPTKLDGILLRAMSRNAHDRFPSARAFGAALLPLAHERDRLAWGEDFSTAHAEGGLATASGASFERYGPEPATPATMPPTARDTRASALQKQAARRVLAAIIGSALVIATVAEWTVRHGHPSLKSVPESTSIPAPSAATESVPEGPATLPTSAPSNGVSSAAQATASALAVATPRPPLRPRLRVVAAGSASAPGAASAPAASPQMGNNGAPILP